MVSYTLLGNPWTSFGLRWSGVGIARILRTVSRVVTESMVGSPSESSRLVEFRCSGGVDLPGV